MQRLLSITILALLWSSVGPTATLCAGEMPTPSFDCRKAETAVENILCADPGLARMDVEMVSLYKQALRQSKQPEQLKQQQRKWLRERDGCITPSCTRCIYECLPAVYRERIAALQQLLHSNSEPSQEVARMIARYDTLNDQCRGGSGDDPATLRACDARDQLFQQIRQKQWCYGRDDQAGYQKQWQPCAAP
ncbi:MAG: DUF1311 domain-containing protein [Magnetococcales bacterium]|nr:DUF1311 domain-containing protein [Magnetococcales bacterium]